MVKVNKLQYNGQEVKSLTFRRSLPVETLNVGTYQWTKEYLRPPLELFYMPSESSGNIITSYEEPLMATGNTVFIAKANAPLDVEKTSISSNGTIRCVPVDTYGFMFIRYHQNGEWPGDSNISFDTTLTLSCKDLTLPLQFKGKIDENQGSLIEGYYVDKVIRIPADGVSNRTIKYHLFPASFDSSQYDPNQFVVKLIEQDTEGALRTWEWKNGQFKSTVPIAYPDRTLSDTIFSAFSITRDNLDCTIHYSIRPSYEGACVSLLIEDSSLITFYQEEPVPWRIYAGVPFDIHYSEGDSYYFNTLGSYFCGFNTSITIPAQSHVLLPSMVVNNLPYTTEPANALQNEGTVTWEGQTYTHLRSIAAGSITLNFT